MNRIFIAAALFAALPCAVFAQVEKQVEVTKSYVPSVESATKLAIKPDMTDTVRMRPEIDYAITPLSLSTRLDTRPIRPATVTYWEFNRPLPFYIKIGAGYPLNSVLDFYASSQNAGTGYVLAYVNHDGRYADIRNDFGVKNNSVLMENRVGVAAGKYLGRHIIEGEISYDNRMYHRYGTYVTEGVESTIHPGALVDYSDVNAAVRFGDDFLDLSRTNFEVALRGGLFYDHSDGIDYGNKARQSSLEARAKIGRGFGRSHFTAEVGYSLQDGQKSIDIYNRQLICGGVRYGYNGGVVTFEAGADYYHDKIKGAEAGNYITPYARLDFDLGKPGLRPFVEIDGSVDDNSYRSLTLTNPYVANPTMFEKSSLLDKSSVDYCGRIGIGGSLWREKFVYRLYAEMAINDNHVYWYGRSWGTSLESSETLINEAAFFPIQGRQTAISIHGEAEYRPINGLRMTLGLHTIFDDDEINFHDGCSMFEGNAGVRYEGRKIAVGISTRMRSTHSWSVLLNDDPTRHEVVSLPFNFDLRLNFDWKLSRRITLFAEGSNLANRPLYDFPWYREYGASFTVGVKANF